MALYSILISDTYGMLVHSCYVEDGQGDRQLVIDERGWVFDVFVEEEDLVEEEDFQEIQKIAFLN